MQHPNREAVQEVIEFILSRHAFRGWRLDGIHYDALHSSYDVACSGGGVTVSVRIMSEWVDEALGKGIGISSRRRIKHALRDAFKIQTPDDDDA